MKSILNVKKTSNLIKGISSHKICSEKSTSKKTIQYQKLDFSQKYFVPFHRFTFDHSISCVLLIDKPNESKKKLKEMQYPPQKKLLKRKGNSITQAKRNAPNFTNFFRRPKINNSNEGWPTSRRNIKSIFAS